MINLNMYIIDYENFALTKNTFFDKNSFYLMHSSENISKDYEQFP